MIDFSRAFDSAWERMIIILFRPFDLGKWFVIGFSAFLAGLLYGGNGLSFIFAPPSLINWNSNTPFRGNFHLPRFDPNQVDQAFTKAFSSSTGWASLIMLGIATVVGLAFTVLIFWLSARGQFLLLDNIVRNRGEVARPWTYYARSGNDLFLFFLILMGVALLTFIPALVVGIIMGFPFFQQHRWPAGAEMIGFGFLGTVCGVLALMVNLFLFVFLEMGVPLMFRLSLTWSQALVETLGLFRKHPGNLALFILLRFALFVALIITLVLTCCCCCVGGIPYVGTVVILPAIIYIRCFTLDCLAQFGPHYDVWTVDVPPAAPPIAPA